jgi:alginate O-acetyltransferase complex protein AlgJ
MNVPENSTAVRATIASKERRGQDAVALVRSRMELLTIAVFVLLITLPTLDTCLHLDRAPFSNENRTLAKWPTWHRFAKLQGFVAGLESYFNDHFGFRNQLVRWNNGSKFHLFRMSSNPDVLIGREGWLFYIGSPFYESWTGASPWTERDLENWRKLFERRRKWLQARGIKYLVAIPPDKQTVYPEYLPDWLQQVRGRSRVVQFVEYMKAHSTVPVVDLSKPLIEGKSNGINFCKTDTHWNSRGAFLGYRALMQAMTNQLPNVYAVSTDAYDWRALPEHNRDLSRMMGQGDSFVETNAFNPVLLRRLPVATRFHDPARFPFGPIDEQAPVSIRNEKASHKLMFFRDSFARAYMPFVSQSFRETIYIWHRQWDWAMIEREKPDVVVDEFVERLFAAIHPDQLQREDEKTARQANIALE